MLLGKTIKVFTDHKNLVHKHFNAERVVRWRLLLEFGPQMTGIKGANNIVLARLRKVCSRQKKTRNFLQQNSTICFWDMS